METEINAHKISGLVLTEEEKEIIKMRLRELGYL
jgi:hypothetical protein